MTALVTSKSHARPKTISYPSPEMIRKSVGYVLSLIPITTCTCPSMGSF